jgi:NAD(P)H-dependent flavin oxidoreductase YrpB (nitropropane dioxygenase family)
MITFSKFNGVFGCKKPIIQAGMGPYDTTNLAAAVSKAGALGLISTVAMGSLQMPEIGVFKYSATAGEGTPEELLTSSIDRVVEGLSDYPDAKFGINIPVSEEFIPAASRIIRTAIDRVNRDPSAKEKCRVIVTSAGDPLPWAVDPLNKEIEESIPIKKELPDITWCHVVPSVRAAKRCEKANVDVVIASGREGGAHCSWRDTSSMVLIPEVVKAIKKPVVATGGFADGRSLIAASGLGAIGIQMGTRFIATQESDFEQGWKELLVSATEEDTLIARGFFGPMRFLRNKRSIELVDATIRGSPDLYKGIPTGSTQEIIDLEVGGLENLFRGNIDATPILGGIVAGRIHDIPKVKDLIDGIIKEADSVLEELKIGEGF